MSSSSSQHRTRLLGALALLAVLVVSGCSTDSPPQHSERLQKAAGLKTFHVETTKTLWEKTSDQTNRDGPDLELKPTTKELDNGLIQIELTGVDLANYLRVLDYMAHGGTDSHSLGTHHSAESIRMYDEIAGVLDGINTRPDPKDPPPHVVVDTAYLEAKNRK
ncbi:hypothetical protein OG906_43070 (plasmid) [Streptomyces sp. NBC_01426]|uniref:hypothetical protein n=1 Tax=Streptomyces sp. NBC_01426 TaxID=2975866 RepID=UPI002E343889|nr:hypothetical protein [Streptomyces sp. NBC_01426]